MFDSLSTLPSDPILGLMQKYLQDPNPGKIDLGVGVYKNAHGETPVLESVKFAEQWLLQEETSKTYVGPAGNTEFNRLIAELCLGEQHSAIADGRVATLQTPGGCGALRVAAELIKRSKPDSKIWVSTPTWANHIPLLGDAGVGIEEYPYYDYTSKVIDFDRMISQISMASPGDLILLHGCCHNPSGADLTQDQWKLVSALCLEKGLVPFIDMAYQGFGDSVVGDRFGLAHMVETQPEVLFALSCSKNFGLYRERVGAVGVVCRSIPEREAAFSHLLNIVRGIYSMPPSHGASVVAKILGDTTLKGQWESELGEMRSRIVSMRQGFCTQMRNFGLEERFSHVLAQKGMFSFLGVSENEVARLATEYSIYMVDSSRVNLAGLSGDSIHTLCNAIYQVIEK